MFRASKILPPRTGSETDSTSHQIAQQPGAVVISDRRRDNSEGTRESRRRQWLRYLMEMYGVAANR